MVFGFMHHQKAKFWPSEDHYKNFQSKLTSFFQRSRALFKSCNIPGKKLCFVLVINLSL